MLGENWPRFVFAWGQPWEMPELRGQTPEPIWEQAASHAIETGVLLLEVSAGSAPVVPPFGVAAWGMPWESLPVTLPRGGTTLIFVSDRDWTSRPSDTIGSREYPGLLTAPEIEWALPLVPDGQRGVAAALGDLLISNRDGAFDSLPDDVGIDGRPVRLKYLSSAAAAYADAKLVINAIGVQWWAPADAVRISVRDRLWLLEVPSASVYSGKGGATGSAQVAGRVVPQAYGLVRNVPGVLIDPFLNIWQVHDREIEGVIAAKVGGLGIDPGNGHASFALLAAAVVAGGTYDWSISEDGSYVRLGSNPVLPVTFDLKGDARGGYVQDPSRIARRLLERAILSSDIDLASFTALSVRLPYAAGFYIDSAVTVGDSVRQLLASVAGWIGDAGNGLISVGKLGPPGTVGLAIGVDQIVGDIEPMQLPETLKPCLWRATVACRRNWAPLSEAEIAGSITDTADRQALRDEWVLAPSSRPERRGQHPLAVDLPVLVSCLDSPTDAAAVASNLLSLYAPGRGLWSVPLGSVGLGIELGSSLLITWPRFGFANGKAVVVVAKRMRGNRVDLIVFG